MPAGYIDRETADALRRRADAYDKADVALRLAIMEAVEKGISLRAIARSARMNYSTVRRTAKVARAELDEHGRLLTSRDTFQDPYGGPPRDPLDRRKPWQGDVPNIRDDPEDQGPTYGKDL